MKNILLFLFTVTFVFSASAKKNLQSTKIPVSANQKEDSPVFNIKFPAGILFGEFKRTDGPFLIEGSVVVPAGQVLKFEAGSRIYVGGDYSTITVFGQLICKGTEEQPIEFRSAKKHPNPWDWDRIYCRSRNKTILEHCIIKHSNYGVFVENGSILIKNCLFERNSLHGLVIKNSDATIYNTTIRKGHVLGLFCRAGSNVKANNLYVKDNSTGIACDNQSIFNMTGGEISGNGSGIAITKNASVSIIAADVTKNKIGVVSEIEIPKKMMTMVYGNIIPVQRVDDEKMTKLLKSPEAVKSIVLPKSKTKIKVPSSFKSGFSALKAPKESQTSFIGNIEVGAEYFYPNSVNHPISDTLIRQTRYLGEQGQITSNGKFDKSIERNMLDGLQPEVTIFAQGKRNGVDINLNADLFSNTWIDKKVPLKKNMFALSLNYEDQSLLIGDSYENISETSMSGRKITGVRYSGSFFDMGRGTKRLEFKLVGGQSEVPKDSGDHELEIPGAEVDTGFSVRQQLTYVASVSLHPTLFSTISVRGIISHDQNEKPLFGTIVKDPAAPKPIFASTGIIDGSVVLLDGQMEVFAEVNMGAIDTVDSQDAEDIAWYNPQVTTAIPRVFSVINPDSSNYAFTLGTQGKLKEFDLSLSFTEIADNYFSAGNPYLEADRRYLTFTGERSFFDNNLETGLTYTYTRTSVSNDLDITGSTPTDKNKLSLKGKYSFGDNLPSLSVNYGVGYNRNDENQEQTILSLDSANGVLDTVVFTQIVKEEIKELNSSLTIEERHRLKNGINYSIKYRLMRDNELTKHKIDPIDDNLGDAWMNEISGKFGFKIKRIVRNKTSLSLKVKDKVKDSLTTVSVKISDNLRLTIIPRKLNLNIKGEYQRKKDDEAGIENDALSTTTSGTLEAKYSITSKMSVSAVGKYEEVYNESEGSENYNVIIGGIHLTYLF